MGRSTLTNETDRGRASDFDALLDVCTDERRQLVLLTLAAENRALTVRDLLHAIAEHMHHTPVGELSAEVINETLVTLHHCHLPKLAAVDLVEYDPERGLVEPTEKFDDVSPTVSAILDARSSLDTVGDE